MAGAVNITICTSCCRRQAHEEGAHSKGGGGGASCDDTGRSGSASTLSAAAAAASCGMSPARHLPRRVVPAGEVRPAIQHAVRISCLGGGPGRDGCSRDARLPCNVAPARAAQLGAAIVPFRPQHRCCQAFSVQTITPTGVFDRSTGLAPPSTPFGCRVPASR